LAFQKALDLELTRGFTLLAITLQAP